MARDLHVLRERLRSLIAAKPPGLVFGPAFRRIDEQIGADLQAARLAVLNALDNQRYFRLLDLLEYLLCSTSLAKL